MYHLTYFFPEIGHDPRLRTIVLSVLFPFHVHFCFWCGKYSFPISGIGQCSKKVAFISSFRRDLIKNFSFGEGLIIKAFGENRARKSFVIFSSQLCRDKLRQLIIAFKVESVQKSLKCSIKTFCKEQYLYYFRRPMCQSHQQFSISVSVPNVYVCTYFVGKRKLVN